VQRYVIDPVFWSVTDARPPGLIVPVSNAPLLVAVCGAVSLLMNVTVDPRETVWGFGEYAVVVNANAPATIETDGPPGDVFDVDGAVELLLLQATVSVTTNATHIGRRVICNFLRIFRRNTFANVLPLAPSRAPHILSGEALNRHSDPVTSFGIRPRESAEIPQDPASSRRAVFVAAPTDLLPAVARGGESMVSTNPPPLLHNAFIAIRRFRPRH
jgi:hypothetical protein